MSSSHSIRSSIFCFEYPCTRMGSRSESEIGRRGSREAIGSWKTIEISARRRLRSSLLSWEVSVPLKRMRPPCSGSSFMISMSVVVLPQPDSPTSAKHSPSWMSKEMPSTARCSPILRRNTAPLVIG